MPITITNTSSTDPIRWLEWGEEQRSYTPASPAPLTLDSDSLVVTGFAGAQTTRTGSYDPNASGNNIISATVGGTPTAVCGTGSQSHVGRFKVAARVYVPSAQVRMRMTSRTGDGSYLPAGGWKAPAVINAFGRVDLGVIDVPAAVTGTQAWDGRVEAYSLDGTLTTADVDFIYLIPADEGYGVSRAQTSETAGAVVALDGFTSTTSGGALNARTPPIGAAWATSGAATDFAFIDALAATYNANEAVSRSVSTAAFRFGILGPVMTDTQVDALIGFEAVSPIGTGEHGVIARWVDSSNYLRLTVTPFLSVSLLSVSLYKVVAGVATLIGSTFTSDTSGGHSCVVRLTAYATGAAVADVFGGTTGTRLGGFRTTDSVLATGGTLDDGKAGIVDGGDGTNTYERFFDDIVVTQPPAELVPIYPGRRLQLRSTDTLRESSAGGAWGKEQSYRGARPLIPAAGTGDRTSRLVVIAHKNDLSTMAWEPVTASYTLQTSYSPRGLAVPR